MPDVRGCHLPDDLLYDVDNHIWYREQPDGNVQLGMTAVATAMAGKLVAFTPKKVGRSVDAGKSCATVESGKWVGPAKSAAAGTVTAVNEALADKPALANEDPYGAGWLVVLKPADWAVVKQTLTPGAQVAPKYEARMAADGFARLRPCLPDVRNDPMNRADVVSAMNLAELQARAMRATSLLKAMANPVRLLVLCQLAEGEKSVGELERVVDVSQSALSQHLALLRERGLVSGRRAGQAIYYSLAGPEAPALLAALYEVYCSKAAKARTRRAQPRPA